VIVVSPLNSLHICFSLFLFSKFAPSDSLASATFYGLSSVLPLYFVSLGLSKNMSGFLTNFILFVNYGLTLIGGIAADSSLGTNLSFSKLVFPFFFFSF
jgi:hypothetical protein